MADRKVLGTSKLDENGDLVLPPAARKAISQSIGRPLKIGDTLEFYVAPDGHLTIKASDDDARPDSSKNIRGTRKHP